MTNHTAIFQPAEDLVLSMNTIIPSMSAQAQAIYAGFFAVSVVTVYELAIKEIFIEFARSKDQVFGNFASNSFKRINGRITIKALKEHLDLFGDNYKDKFSDELNIKANTLLRANGVDLTSSYNNVITCRHKFVHGGQSTLTYNECKDNYNVGKEVIDVLNTILV